MSKYSKKAGEYISKKMSAMKKEEMPQKQKVAIAMSMAREKGLKVPKPRKGNPHDLKSFLDHPQIKSSLPRK